MSDARAIEAVTETMRSIVDAGVKRVSAGARAIAAPPHEVAASLRGGNVVTILCDSGERYLF